MNTEALPVLDVLALDHPKDTEKSMVRAFGGRKLNRIFDKLCKKLKRKTGLGQRKTARELFQVNVASMQNWRGQNVRYPNGHPIPLRALSKILDLLNLKHSDQHTRLVLSIKKLQSGRVGNVGECVAAVRLTPKLAQLCGAHAADGCLSAKHGRGPICATWDLADHERANVMAAKGWVEDLFGIKMRLERKTNAYYVRSTKQVLARYLNRLFDFPIGEKTYVVEEPKILKGGDSRLLTQCPDDYRRELRLNFAREAINFDGHSTEVGTVPSVGFFSKSRKLRESVLEIFQGLGVKFQNYEKHERIMTTSRINTEKLCSLGLFKGWKRRKLKRLLKCHQS